MPAAQSVTYFRRALPHAAHLAIGLDAGELTDTTGYLELGLDLDVSTVLTTAEVTRSQRPVPGCVVRPLAGDDDWRQSLELHLTCWHDGPPDAGLHDFAVAQQSVRRALTEAGQGAWFGAFVNDRLRSQLGIVNAGPSMDGEQLARYQNVETDPQFRNLGLASSLVERAGRYALEVLAVDRLVIVADPLQHAIGLYRGIGFVDREVQVQLQTGVGAPPAAGI